jgi:hypothetical protein
MGSSALTSLRSIRIFLANPQAAFAVSKLFLETVRRFVGYICIKLPIALLLGAKDLPRIWPLIDAVIAVGNYQGFARASVGEPSRIEALQIIGCQPYYPDCAC